MKARASHDRLQAALLDWFRRSKRRLPWRTRRNPYRVWVSEVMLQQTTVKTTVPYYERFLERFPTVEALAASKEEDVLGAWSGLGYYHRARNLHRGARVIVERHGGAFPSTLEAALALPGVGLYTASAVLSIAHGVPLPVVDGNVRRVLSRLFALRGPAWRKDAAYYNCAQEILPVDAPGDWNEALMELGATICTPRNASCPACPVRTPCEARRRGLVDRLPEMAKRRAPVAVTVAAAVVEEKGRVLLVRRAEGRLLGRMWELPQTSLESRGLPDLVKEMKERHSLRVVPGPLIARMRHAITFRRIEVQAYRATLERRPLADAERLKWATRDEIASLPTSSLTRKVLRGVAAAQMPLPIG